MPRKRGSLERDKSSATKYASTPLPVPQLLKFSVINPSSLFTGGSKPKSTELNPSSRKDRWFKADALKNGPQSLTATRRNDSSDRTGQKPRRRTKKNPKSEYHRFLANVRPMLKQKIEKKQTSRRRSSKKSKVERGSSGLKRRLHRSKSRGMSRRRQGRSQSMYRRRCRRSCTSSAPFPRSRAAGRNPRATGARDQQQEQPRSSNLKRPHSTSPASRPRCSSIPAKTKRVSFAPKLVEFEPRGPRRPTGRMRCRSRSKCRRAARSSKSGRSRSSRRRSRIRSTAGGRIRKKSARPRTTRSHSRGKKYGRTNARTSARSSKR